MGAVFVAGFLVVGLRLYFGFKAAADVPFSPTEASAALAERTPAEVEEGRKEIIEQDEVVLDDQPADEVLLPAVEEEVLEEPPGEPAEELAEEIPEQPAPEPVAFTRSTARLPDSMFDTVLMMGADASGYLADSIIFACFPKVGRRRPWFPSPATCTSTTSAPRTSGGERQSGRVYRVRQRPELLALTIEDFTGVAVDHFARVDFEGFVELVDGLGGVQVCFEYPTRDEKAELDIVEPGCYSDGETALAYARSRNALQLVDGEWQQAWSSDFARQQHQRDLLLNLAGSLRNSSRLELLGSLQKPVPHPSSGPGLVGDPGG